MSEHHQFHRPESRGKKNRLLPRLPNVIPIIKSPFSSKSPNPEKQPVKLETDDQKSRRRSAPPRDDLTVDDYIQVHVIAFLSL